MFCHRPSGPAAYGRCYFGCLTWLPTINPKLPNLVTVKPPLPSLTAASPKKHALVFATTGKPSGTLFLTLGSKALDSPTSHFTSRCTFRSVNVRESTREAVGQGAFLSVRMNTVRQHLPLLRGVVEEVYRLSLFLMLDFPIVVLFLFGRSECWPTFFYFG